MNPLTIVLIVVGSIMVYGARMILRIIYKVKEVDDVKVIVVKFMGLIIAGAGCLRILGII